jgi:L-asparaginase II
VTSTEAVTLVRVIRSGLPESEHAGDVAVVDAGGRIQAYAGDPHRKVFARSSMKPLQAAVSLSLAPMGFTDREVAVMAASHNAEPVHLEAVRSILERGGIAEAELRCPAVRSRDEDSRRRDPRRLPINSDCSGKHAGMLAACHSQGWPSDTYRHPDHPLQEAILRAVRSITGTSSVDVGVDGCGVPVHGMPLTALAWLFARLDDPPAWAELAPFAARVAGAMRAHPYLVAGRNRVDTAVMQARPDLLVKGGAEGLVCATDRSGVGIAVKIRDGAARAVGPALINVLRLRSLLDEDQSSSLGAFARPPVLGGGQPVGDLVASFGLNEP